MLKYKTIGKRQFHLLKQGEMFAALVKNISPGEVTIKFDSGELYTARTNVQTDARIGEKSVFLVKENDFEGRIVLEILKNDPERISFDMRV